MNRLAPLSVVCLLLSQASAQEVKYDIPYAQPAHERQVLDVYPPFEAKNLPVVFWIDGGDWRAGDKSDFDDLPEVFIDQGFVFVATNYRRLPDVDLATMMRDIAKSIRWVHDHIAEYGGDPQRLLVMGPSAGAQLAALICTDDRYLKAEGLSLSIIKGCVPIDGDSYDVPAIIETAETRRRVHGQPQPRFGHREKFGNDPAKHRDLSAVTHVAKGKDIPPFLILHVADNLDHSAQAQRLGNVLKDAGLSATVFAAQKTNRPKSNTDIGQANDPAINKALFEFFNRVLGRQASKTDTETTAKFRDVDYNGWFVPFIQASPSHLFLNHDLFELSVTKSNDQLRSVGVTLQPTRLRYHQNPAPNPMVGAWPITKFTRYEDLNGNGEFDWILKSVPSKERPNAPNDNKEYIVVGQALIEVQNSRIRPDYRKEFITIDGAKFVMTPEGWAKR